LVCRELADTDVKNVVTMVRNETSVCTDKGDVHRFTYDYSFSSFDPLAPHNSSQSDVYQAIGKPLLSKVLEGYNACLFAYGQTGSGKSYRLIFILYSYFFTVFCHLEIRLMTSNIAMNL